MTTMSFDKDGFSVDFTEKSVLDRKCSACQLCCKLLPVRSIDKKANQRCVHQRAGKGCMVYHHRSMPMDCKLWSCQWLTNTDTIGLGRPDRVHYVIDMMPDMIKVEQADGTAAEITVLQIWVDPAFPHAHRDPALRRYVEMIAARDRTPTLIRYTPGHAFVLIAPCLNREGVWLEAGSNLAAEKSATGNRYLDHLTASMRP